MRNGPGADPARRGRRVVSHTADAGLEVWGTALGDVYAEAAVALFELMGAPRALSPAAPFAVEACGVDREDVLVRILAELLAAFELEGRFVTDAECVVAGLRTRGDWHVVLRCRGGRVDRDRERGLAAIKAVTYHGLELREHAGGLRARVHVDV